MIDIIKNALQNYKYILPQNGSMNGEEIAELITDYANNEQAANAAEIFKKFVVKVHFSKPKQIIINTCIS